MCIIDSDYFYGGGTGDIRSIAATKICVFPCNDSYNQVTVYKNKVSLRNDNPVAMILPVPTNNTTESNTIKMIDNSEDINGDKLFDVLEDMFYEPEMSFGSYDDVYSYNSRPKLAIKKCGSYEYSVVPSINDFHRIDDELMKGTPSEKVLGLLQKNYSKDFAFIVCKIQKNKEYHPIMYMHPLKNSELFVPTLHFHGEYEKNPEWDHAIYALQASDKFGNMCNENLLHKIPKYYSDYMPKNILNKNMRYREIYGTAYGNSDIIIPLFIKKEEEGKGMSILQRLTSYIYN